MRVKILIALMVSIAGVNSSFAQTTAFTYQGKLTDGANAANGNYDLEFRLFDQLAGGTQQGATLQRLNVAVTNGIFTVQLDFDNQFSGATRFIDISVRPASGGTFTQLAPRQQVTSNPYAIKSLNAATADGLSIACLSCVTSSQIASVNGSAVTGTIPVASVPAGSGNYVQNTTSPQSASNFNISGNGTAGGTLSANAVTSTTQFNIGVNRVLALGTSASVFAGRLAGVSNTTGSGNSFFGDSAGRFNTNTSNNSFFGRDAGTVNTAGDNSFFGAFSGSSNTTGSRNSFFGVSSGDANVSANDNSFFGYRAGRFNTANFNSFFGSGAGTSNTTGVSNAFFGYNSGQANSIGTRNSFFGSFTGTASTDATDNTFFGYETGFSNTASFNSFFGSFAGDSNTTGANNAFFGRNAGTDNTTGGDNSFFGNGAGHDTTSGQRNSFVGSNAGGTNISGSDNTAIGAGALVGNIASFATAIGAGAVNNTSNSILLGRSIDSVRIPGNLNVTGSFSPGNLNVTGTLDVASSVILDDTLLVFGDVDFRGFLEVSGRLVLDNLGPSGSTNLCRNASNQVATCSSSLRYKTGVQNFAGGLDIVRRLRPIAFRWKEGGMHDVGFGAEEVEKVEPLLTTRNDKGEIEGVKYGHITTVLVNAVKEQQQLIEQQQKEIDALRILVCQSYPNADVCK